MMEYEFVFGLYTLTTVSKSDVSVASPYCAEDRILFSSSRLNRPHLVGEKLIRYVKSTIGGI
jgi:hypothetical protein